MWQQRGSFECFKCYLKVSYSRFNIPRALPYSVSTMESQTWNCPGISYKLKAQNFQCVLWHKDNIKIFRFFSHFSEMSLTPRQKWVRELHFRGNLGGYDKKSQRRHITQCVISWEISFDGIEMTWNNPKQNPLCARWDLHIACYNQKRSSYLYDTPCTLAVLWQMSATRVWNTLYYC